MITWKDFYTVMSAVVPLYVAMFLAYGSVRWWRIFTPDQCSGINRFAAVFAIPLLSFHFIATNDPYAMNLRFIAADTLQKLIILSAMAIWSNISSSSTHPLDWVITIFSLSTLPNTLVMGIPLLVAMYGDYSGALMVQIVVLQCVIWYTLILFLFEYRAARLLILAQFPNGAASSIVSLKVDSDVGSLVAGEEFLQADAEVGDDGKIRVTVRKSTSSLITPRISNLTGAEIYSLNPTPRGSNFNPSDMCSSQGSVHSDRGQTQKQMTANHRHSHEAKELHMFVWSSNGSQVSGEQEAKEIRMIIPGDPQESRSVIGAEGEDRGEEGEIRSDLSSPKRNMTENNRQMPPASVMIRLILVMVWRKIIRNPNTYSSLLGLVWALVAFRWHVAMPRIMEKSISILSDAGLGMAMFSLGLFMASQPKIIACGNTAASLAMAARFVAGPAVMAVASIALGLRGTILHIAIVQAALPQGIVTFVFAKEYSLHPTILSTGVIFGMLIALPITLLYYTILGL